MRRSLQISLVSLALALPAACFAQDRPLFVADASPALAPLSCSGSVTVNNSASLPFWLDVHLTARNVSKKSITLRVLRVDITHQETEGEEQQGSAWRIDEFFFDSFWEPGAEEALEMPVTNAVDPPASSITVTTVFVQFSDGTTWGDADIGKQWLNERASTLKNLRKLSELAKSADKEQFASALISENSGLLRVIDDLKRAYHDTKDADAVAKRIDLILQNADSRLREMTNGPAS